MKHTATLRRAAAFVLVLAFGLALTTDAQDQPKRKFTDAQLANPTEPNPYLSFRPAGQSVNWEFWAEKARVDGQRRRAQRGGLYGKAQTISYAETEVGGAGTNNSIGTAEAISGFGRGAGEDNDVIILGSLAPPPSAGTPVAENEGTGDNGDINKAIVTGLTSGNVVQYTGRVGDGPFGSDNGGTSGDYDFYEISMTAGDSFFGDIDTPVPFGALDTIVGMFAADGTELSRNDDGDASSWDSFLSFTAPATGTYYFVVRGFGLGFQSDPFDSSSGLGIASEGDYTLTMGLSALDVDFYTIDLDQGDVLGVNALFGALGINVYGPDGTNYQGSSQDLSFIYAPDSPLPGGGNGVVAVVADVAGTYAIEVTGGADTYVIEASAFGAGLEEELTKAANKQTLFIDFDGETINAPALFGSGNNPAVLSPLVDFLPGWGLTAADEDAVIDAILKSIEESVKTDLASVAGVAGRFNVEILNSRDHADPGNANNTSRLIVGGSIAELGLSTIGIAEFIDPGNYGTNDTAVTLLDLLSAGSTNPNSLNQFPLGNGATIIDLIGTGVGNITAHEAGHFLGLFHTDQFNGTPNIQDQGGNLANSVGVGPNGIYETPIDNFKAHGHSHAKSAPGGDDVDVDFLDDVYVSNEGLRGIEQSAPTVAYGLFSNDPLPVEYTAFTATAIDQDVLLAWTTGTEVDNAGFFVEQLQDGRFVELGFVEGVGSSVEAVDYRYTISDLLPGTHTFRLKQVDFNGEFAYSAEVEATVEVPGGYLITEAYPNPFNPLATFTLGVSAEQNVRVELYNATGQLVSTIHNGELSANTMHTFRIDGADLPSGLYLYRAVGESFVTNAQRVLLVK